MANARINQLQYIFLLSSLSSSFCHPSDLNDCENDSKAELPSAVRIVIQTNFEELCSRYRDNPIIQQHIKTLEELRRQRALIPDHDPAHHNLDLKIINQTRTIENLANCAEQALNYYYTEISPFRPLKHD